MKLISKKYCQDI